MKVRMRNISISTDGVNYKPLCSTKEVDLKTNDSDIQLPELVIPSEPIKCSFTIHKKKNGNLLERCLYYKNHKKKRIRKKYDFIRILEKGR